MCVREVRSRGAGRACETRLCRARGRRRARRRARVGASWARLDRFMGYVSVRVWCDGVYWDVGVFKENGVDVGVYTSDDRCVC